MMRLEEVLALLSGHRRSGKGYKARCPAHDDGKPSLGVWKRPDGNAGVKCHAGCSEDQVWAALGVLKPALHLPAPKSWPVGHSPAPDRVFATPDEAARSYGFGDPSRWSPYRTADGTVVGRALRWDYTDGRKSEHRPLSFDSIHWRPTAPLAPRPLLGLPEINSRPDETVYVAEGEKCADVLQGLGLLATTNFGGCNAFRLTDWGPLANRSVVILPDNDECGGAYAEGIAHILAPLGARVRIVELPGRPEGGGDVANLISGTPTDEDRRLLLDLISSHVTTAQEFAMTKTTDADPPAEFVPFPTDALPDLLRELACSAAAAIECDPTSVALPCLTTTGVAAANWRLQLKPGWEVVPAIWTVVAAASGERKSPPLDIPLDIFRSWQRELDREFSALPRQQQAQTRPKTIWTDNATVEGLNAAFQTNERGILFGCDELSTWLGNLGAYKNGRSHGDVGWYCQRYSGRASNAVRKGKDHQGGCADGILGITGCVTVGVLGELLTPSHADAGLLARLVMAMPPVREHRWSEATVPATTKDAYRSLLERLAADKERRLAWLSEGAKSAWVDFHDRHNEELETEPDGCLAAALRKQEELPARLALIFHAVEGDADTVSAENMKRAIEITGWIKQETRRVYQILGYKKRADQSGPEFSAAKVKAFISHKGMVTARDVQRSGPPCCRQPGVAQRAIDQLVEAGEVIAVETADESGRPTTKYRIASSPDNAEPAEAIPATDIAFPEYPDEDPSSWTTLPPL